MTEPLKKPSRRRVLLENIGPHKSQAVEWSGPLQVVGPNGAGKTTILKALALAMGNRLVSPAEIANDETGIPRIRLYSGEEKDPRVDISINGGRLSGKTAGQEKAFLLTFYHPYEAFSEQEMGELLQLLTAQEEETIDMPKIAESALGMAGGSGGSEENRIRQAIIAGLTPAGAKVTLDANTKLLRREKQNSQRRLEGFPEFSRLFAMLPEKLRKIRSTDPDAVEYLLSVSREELTATLGRVATQKDAMKQVNADIECACCHEKTTSGDPEIDAAVIQIRKRRLMATAKSFPAALKNLAAELKDADALLHTHFFIQQQRETLAGLAGCPFKDEDLAQPDAFAQAVVEKQTQIESQLKQYEAVAREFSPEKLAATAAAGGGLSEVGKQNLSRYQAILRRISTNRLAARFPSSGKVGRRSKVAQVILTPSDGAGRLSDTISDGEQALTTLALRLTAVDHYKRGAKSTARRVFLVDAKLFDPLDENAREAVLSVMEEMGVDPIITSPSPIQSQHMKFETLKLAYAPELHADDAEAGQPLDAEPEKPKPDKARARASGIAQAIPDDLGDLE
jgi:recombinational DNA repair ATPase RecF